MVFAFSPCSLRIRIQIYLTCNRQSKALSLNVHVYQIQIVPNVTPKIQPPCSHSPLNNFHNLSLHHHENEEQW